ncbi:Type-1 restriction enzyme R protein [Neolewinella maritima]|uniref:Type I restriction enzyme endonuclease subunit n=1 Tax=Neolewinella maritima TaxID=1383882 RepID=A0ABN8F0I7_9BACT|nr:type I restriction endonuclease subunit R [Neolewinella maritima]CAH0999455.1 Type-1 restriction enzyme R protein [Neolewinella maritima]
MTRRSPSTQSEAALEEQLMAQLTTLGYDRVTLPDEAALLTNLRRQLERHNGLQLSETEYQRILNHLDKGNAYDRAKTLRDRMQLQRDDGTSTYVRFLNTEHWCQNEYQVTNQVTLEGSYKNRYDVTLLINGLPLVQIELKRRGVEMKEAFNQINRYHRHSFRAARGLYQYVQIFVISNGVNTKYYANNRRQEFKQTFYWTDAANQRISKLQDFAREFLEKCHVSKMICKYIVQHHTYRLLMVLRPYQYYAVEAIIDRVKNSRKNGYIWHTTGSGKTLTSFKAAQVLVKLPEVHKVVFVVDRKDLDYQTTREFNEFSKGSVDGTDNTGTLVTQLADDTKLIVTTIQKLNTAITGSRYEERVAHLRDKRVVFIFDECHRSQFGDTHQRIVAFFTQAQLFGFTGTPIFADNAVAGQGGKQTTLTLFERCLHKYVITNAIRDENVLKFSIEYVGRYRNKEDGNEVALDIDVEAIDTRELLDDPGRLEKVTDWIIANHGRKTHQRRFTAIFAVSSVDNLIKYYELFRERDTTGLRIATIFSYTANEEDREADGMIGEPDFDNDGPANVHTRDRLESFIEDYNRHFGTSFTTRDGKKFYNYYKDIGKRIKDREKDTASDDDRVDILLVVNMFLTGFDAKLVNTLYVDKNLRYHGLIQAFSRTNRIIGEVKSQGNIVSFRNLKKATDEAIALFSNPEAKEVILMEPYEVYVQRFNEALADLIELVPSPEAVDRLLTEEDELSFVQAFRKLIRIDNVLTGFSEYDMDDVAIDLQTFEDYKSKYLDIRDKVRTEAKRNKVSILNDVDFEVELIHRDQVNVSYIIRLLTNLHTAKEQDKAARRQEITTRLNNEVQLRSKRELIEKFIEQELPRVGKQGDVEQEFTNFWSAERQRATVQLAEEEQLSADGLQGLIDTTLFNGREPSQAEVQAVMTVQPSILRRTSILNRVQQRLAELLERFYDDM